MLSLKQRIEKALTMTVTSDYSYNTNSSSIIALSMAAPNTTPLEMQFIIKELLEREE